MKIEIEKHEIENLKVILEAWYKLSYDTDTTWNMTDHMHNEYDQAEGFIDSLLVKFNQ